MERVNELSPLNWEVNGETIAKGAGENTELFYLLHKDNNNEY